MDETSYQSNDPRVILRARIALLASAIGGPDYTSQLDPPPYRLGDDCLSCLKDLKRWFKLVDDQQNRWDVAKAVAEYNILVDDLIPILLDWEQKSYLASKLSKQTAESSVSNNNDNVFTGRLYYDKIALNCLQLLVLMTWPLILTDQSTTDQVTYYSELKKHQLVYKKAILSTDNGRVLKAVLRIASNVMKIDKLRRTTHDNLILKLVLNFYRNVLAIEPGELTITTKKRSNKGITSTDTLPPSVSLDDISLDTVINVFHRNKIFNFILTLGSSLSNEFDQNFLNTPLLEVLFYLTKEVNPKLLFLENRTESNTSNLRNGNGSIHNSIAETELSSLLEQELQMKKKVIKNTSSRHSRFGALLSIQTAEKNRLTVAGGKGLINDNNALQKLDNRKKWNKRVMQDRDDFIVEGLPNNILNSRSKINVFHAKTMNRFKQFIENFIDSGFNNLLKSITNEFTTEQDRMVSLEQVEYLLFFAWFIKYQRLRCEMHSSADILDISEVYHETSFILMSSLLRTSFEEKNWIVLHASMIAFNELLLSTKLARNEASEEEINFILSKLLSDDRIQLLSNLPKIAVKHSVQFMTSAIELTDTLLKVLKEYSDKKNSLYVESKKRKGKASAQVSNITEEDIQHIMKIDEIDRDEAIDFLTSSNRQIEINFGKVLSKYLTESVIDTYIRLLQRYQELEHKVMKKILSFFYIVFIEAKEEALLFRFDLILLFRDMLSNDGISRSASIKSHLDQFTKYYLNKLKKKLKKSPAWFVGILFPPLHDSEIGYFQRFGEQKEASKASYYGVTPSIIKNIDGQDSFSEPVLKDMHFGILVSAMIDDGKLELLKHLISHLNTALANFKSWYALNIQNGSETEDPPNEFFHVNDIMFPNATLLDSDLRALLKLIGHHNQMDKSDKCYLPGSINILILESAISSITLHISTPFETPNKKNSASYLIRPQSRYPNMNQIDGDGWNVEEQYDYNDDSIIHDSDNNGNENDYFKNIDNSTRSSNFKDSEKGVAKVKKSKIKKSRMGGRLAMNNTDDGIHQKKSRLAISSREFISDSEDDETMSPTFFENEMYMRYLLDKHNGMVPEKKYSLFTKFTLERMSNNGQVVNDYSELFDGPIPPISSLSTANDSTLGPDKTLISLTHAMNYEDEEFDDGYSSLATESIDKTSNSVLPSNIDQVHNYMTGTSISKSTPEFENATSKSRETISGDGLTDSEVDTDLSDDEVNTPNESEDDFNPKLLLQETIQENMNENKTVLKKRVPINSDQDSQNGETFVRRKRAKIVSDDDDE